MKPRMIEKPALERAASACLTAFFAVAVAFAGARAAAENVAPQRTAADAAQLERRLHSVKTLVESSSAARQIEASGNAQASAQRNKARQLVRLAEEAHAARDDRSAASLLDDAARQMLEGTRLASGQRARGDDSGGDVQARMEAVRALLSAQKRISAEKSAAGGAESARQIEQLLEQAASHAAARRFAEARPLAQQAYLLAKASIGTMRGGDTLVRTLNFSSKEEEYHYELDRNDTHRMLFEMLVKKQSSQEGTGAAFIAKAAGLRAQAEASASRGDFAGAVGLLEDATRELVRAIRGAGVFIPG